MKLIKPFGVRIHHISKGSGKIKQVKNYETITKCYEAIYMSVNV